MQEAQCQHLGSNLRLLQNAHCMSAQVVDEAGGRCCAAFFCMRLQQHACRRNALPQFLSHEDVPEMHRNASVCTCLPSRVPRIRRAQPESRGFAASPRRPVSGCKAFEFCARVLRIRRNRVPFSVSDRRIPSHVAAIAVVIINMQRLYVCVVWSPGLQGRSQVHTDFGSQRSGTTSGGPHCAVAVTFPFEPCGLGPTRGPLS
jgi:hypothetical protein